MGLTVNRHMAKIFTVNRKKRNIFTVSRQILAGQSNVSDTPY